VDGDGYITTADVRACEAAADNAAARVRDASAADATRLTSEILGAPCCSGVRLLVPVKHVSSGHRHCSTCR